MLTEEQKKLAKDNLPLAKWCVAKYYRLLGIDIEDAISMANEALCNAAASFNPTIGKFSTYACQAIYMRLITQLQYKSRQKRNFATTSLPKSLSVESDPDSKIISKEIWDKAMPLLSDKEQTIVKMRLVEDLSLREIAETYGVRRQRIAQIEQRAYRKIRRELA